MSDDTETGWRPLSRPADDQGDTTVGADLRRRLDVNGAPILTPFMRLARTHALHAAGDASVAIALAGSLFFSIDPSAARSRVLLYLLCTLAPFALVGPFIGPALDRLKGGRRLVIILTLVLRAVLMILMIPNLDSLWLFPIAFAQLVLGKTYAVAKAATVPTTVNSEDELVDKNARLAVLSALSGFVGAAPALALQRLFGSEATLGWAFLLYAFGIAAATQLPRVMIDDAEVSDDLLQIRSAGVRLAASAMSVLRGVVGFMFFMLAFAFRGGADEVDLSGAGSGVAAAVREALGFELDGGTGEPAWKLGLPLAFWGIGILVGNVIAPRVRERFGEETMILGGLGTVVGAAIASVWAGGLSGAALLALIVGGAPSVAKLAFDSVVQRDAPGANHGAAFGRFETRFQIAWVIGALVPVVLRIPLRLGFIVVAAASLFAAVTYFLGSRAMRQGTLPGELPDRIRWRSLFDRVNGTGADDAGAGDDAATSTSPTTGQEAAPATVGATATASPPPADPHPGAPPTTEVPQYRDPYHEGFAESSIQPPHWVTGGPVAGGDADDLRPPAWLSGHGTDDPDDDGDQPTPRGDYTF